MNQLGVRLKAHYDDVDAANYLVVEIKVNGEFFIMNRDDDTRTEEYLYKP